MEPFSSVPWRFHLLGVNCIEKLKLFMYVHGIENSNGFLMREGTAGKIVVLNTLGTIMRTGITCKKIPL